MKGIALPLFAAFLVFPTSLAEPPRQGALRDLLPRRVPEGRVTAGQAFAIAISDGGSVVAGPYSLKVPGGKGPLVLTLETPAPRPGGFSSPVRLKNLTGFPLSGLRLDVTGATAPESTEPKAPSRDIAISIPSPLWFGDLAPDQETTPLLLNVGDLPEKRVPGPVVILGVVSGAVVVEDPKEVADGNRAYRGRPKQGGECRVDALTDVRGQGFGQAESPVACHLDASGDMWIVDMAGDPVKVFTSRGSFVRSFGPEAAQGATDLVLGGGGRIYLMQPGEEGGAFAVRTLRLF